MCDCINQSDEALREHGLRLSTVIRHNRKTNTLSVCLPIPTERIDGKRSRKQTPTLIGAYCPFCGEKLPESD